MPLNSPCTKESPPSSPSPDELELSLTSTSPQTLKELDELDTTLLVEFDDELAEIRNK